MFNASRHLTRPLVQVYLLNLGYRNSFIIDSILFVCLFVFRDSNQAKVNLSQMAKSLNSQRGIQ